MQHVLNTFSFSYFLKVEGCRMQVPALRFLCLIELPQGGHTAAPMNRPSCKPNGTTCKSSRDLMLPQQTADSGKHASSVVGGAVSRQALRTHEMSSPTSRRAGRLDSGKHASSVVGGAVSRQASRTNEISSPIPSGK